MTLRETIEADVANVFCGENADFGEAVTYYTDADDTTGTEIYGAFVEDSGAELDEDDARDAQGDERGGVLSVATSDVSGRGRGSRFLIQGEEWDVDRVESELEGQTVLRVIRREDGRRGMVD